ncbi:MAG: pantetheine-phosphate adenylyltransferase [Bacteroidetes bacterium]|nr:pantetheine-phosphate adenylyltransferase [Bacteroidota bacterium]MBM3424476.1 pantetheine-phosphate adenylyltransferase [Bacteroidota bacterium]
MAVKRIFFPGSFDPFTKGHEAVVHKALNLFDEVVIGIGMHSNKTPFFSIESRQHHIEHLFSTNRIKVIAFEGLTVDACRSHQCSHLLRGLRNSKDFQYERPIAHMNYDLGNVETVFLLTDLRLSAISSTIVREIYQNNGDITYFVTNADLLIRRT